MIRTRSANIYLDAIKKQEFSGKKGEAPEQYPSWDE